MYFDCFISNETCIRLICSCPILHAILYFLQFLFKVFIQQILFLKLFHTFEKHFLVFLCLTFRFINVTHVFTHYWTNLNEFLRQGLLFLFFLDKQRMDSTVLFFQMLNLEQQNLVQSLFLLVLRSLILNVHILSFENWSIDFAW